jgi:hypothetical protein
MWADIPADDNAGAMPALAALETLSDLAPYVALLAAGFLVAAWGSASKSSLAVALGILLIVAAVLLFQLEANDFSGSNSPF